MGSTQTERARPTDGAEEHGVALAPANSSVTDSGAGPSAGSGLRVSPRTGGRRDGSGEARCCPALSCLSLPTARAADPAQAGTRVVVANQPCPVG